MTVAFLYGTLCTFAYYTLARAKLTEALWSRYPSWLDYCLSCAACAGFWYGLGCAALGAHYGWSLVGLDPRHWTSFLAAGALGAVWTPILAYQQVAAWSALLPGDDDDDTESPPTLKAV